MPFFYENPQRFKIVVAHYSQDFGQLRWTVDTAEDLALVRLVVKHMEAQGKKQDFTWLDVLNLFEEYPELTTLNANIEAKHYKIADQRAG